MRVADESRSDLLRHTPAPPARRGQPRHTVITAHESDDSAADMPGSLDAQRRHPPAVGASSHPSTPTGLRPTNRCRRGTCTLTVRAASLGSFALAA